MRRQLELLLASTDFDASGRSREFLRFVVEESLAGRVEALTQSAIATRVFGRREDFDPLVDPIVRIQAGRLRRSLERYYLLSGRHDSLRIELPRGAYVPAFRPQTESGPPAIDRRRGPAIAMGPDSGWPFVVVGRFAPGASGPEHEAARGLADELALEMGQYGDVRALLQSEVDQWEPSRRAGLRFSLDGTVRQEDGAFRVTARLVDHATGELVWGDEYDTAPRPDGWRGSLNNISRVIAARVGAEEGVIIQLLAAERRKRGPTPVTSFDAILLSYDFFLARDPGSLPPAVAALRQVLKAEPDCGPAWIRLARLCVANHAFEVTSVPTPIDDAITYAHRGVRLDPVSRRARCTLALALLIKGELAAARSELEEALQLSRDSFVYREIIGFLLTLAGDWERGPVLIRTAQELNPHCMPQASFGLWASHLHRGEIEAAQRVALLYRDPTFFWRAVMRACCLGELGRTAEAESEVAELLRSRPDFASRGRVLIGHYIKFPEVTARIVDGLAKAGLKLAGADGHKEKA